MKSFPVKSLLNFRLINKFVEEEATKVAIAHPDIKIRAGNSPRGTLAKLNECIRNSRLFPCGHFRLDYGRETNGLTGLTVCAIAFI